MNNKLISMLGICNRAGKIIFGYDRVEKAVLSDTVKLVLTANDFSAKASEKLTRICRQKGISVIKTPYSINELYYILSYKAGVLGITDSAFADKIGQLLQQDNKEDFAI